MPYFSKSLFTGLVAAAFLACFRILDFEVADFFFLDCASLINFLFFLSCLFRFDLI